MSFTPFSGFDALPLAPAVSDVAQASGERCVRGHSALIYDRGGTNRRAQLVDLTDVSWTRERSKTSEASITISGRACDRQSSTINDVADGVDRYELVLYRGNQRVWEGPIDQVTTRRDNAIIFARDIKHYLDRNPLTKDWPADTASTNPSDPNAPALMTERVRAILAYELTTNYRARVQTGGAANVITIPRWETIPTPANIQPYLDIRKSTTLYSRSNIVAFQMMIGEHLDRLAEGGLDYVVVGRSLVVWDSAVKLGQTKTLTDADFYGDLEVIAAGSEHSAIGHISASRPDGDPSASPVDGVVPGVGNAGSEDPYYGVWTTIHSLEQEEGSDAPSQDALNTQASRLILGRTPVPTEIRVPDGAGLRLSDSLGINDLVPGVIVPVRATLNLRPLGQDQKLDKVAVKETAAGETIQVSLSGAGAVTS